MLNQEELQQIEKEYFEEQKESKLTLCICEKDKEWFYANNKWNYIDIKKERYEGNDWHECYIIKSKSVHTFSKKAVIETLSFEYFMAYKYMTSLYNTDSATCDEVQRFIEKFIEFRKEDDCCTVENYIQNIKEQREKEAAKTKADITNFFLWIITIILIIPKVTIPIAVFTCPLMWKLIRKLKEKYKKQQRISKYEKVHRKRS